MPDPILHALITDCANMEGWRSRLVQRETSSDTVFSRGTTVVVALVSANSIHD